jgi:predicted TIM-barrel fold metal-dependent hydrolase
VCLVGAVPGPLIGNDEVAKLCAAHPGRFVGVASVDLARLPAQ